MFGVVEGKFLSFLTLIILVLLAVFTNYLSKRRSLPSLRNIAALPAINEAIGRATEMGKKVFFTSGNHGLRDSYAPSMIAGTTLLYYIARRCANLGPELYVTIANQEVYPLQFAQVQEAYLVEGKIEAFNPENIVFTGGGYTIQTIGEIERQKPAAFFLLGRPHIETITLTETANHVGAIQVAGCTNFAQTCYMVATCDYVMLGDELLAAGAILSQDIKQLSNIIATDFGKYLTLGILIITLILFNLGVANVINIFNW